MRFKTLFFCGLICFACAANSQKSIASPEPKTDPVVTTTNSNPLQSPSTLKIELSGVLLPLIFDKQSEEGTFAPASLQWYEIAQNSQLGFNNQTRYGPLTNKLFQQPTAQHLRRGEVVFNIINRSFFTEGTGSVEEDGTAAYLNFGATWGILDNLEFTIESQRVDTAFPTRQGQFRANRNPRGENNFLSEQELSFQLKQRFWHNESETLALSGVAAVSIGDRGFSFRDRNGRIVQDGSRSGAVPAFAIPFTASVNDRAYFTFSPTIAFFDEENALHIHRPPVANPGSFGTTFGLTGGISFIVSPRLVLWGDGFVPLTGNNSIDRDSGLPDKTVALNAGVRYLVNPRLGLDIYASNTQGSKIPLALTADRDWAALGVGLLFMPEFVPANRRYSDSFASSDDRAEEPFTTDGLGFFDGGTVPSGMFKFHLQGGSQGVLTALRYGVLKDFELGAYLDYISGDVDESEQGFSAKIRLVNQAENYPLTVSLGATLGITDEVFTNFSNNDKREFDRRNIDAGVPFFFQRDNEEGRRFVATVSLPINYDFENGAGIWLTPIVGFAQRLGTEIAGFNVGGSAPLPLNFSLIGEVGANFAGRGNAFIGNRLEDRIPWNVGFQWNPEPSLNSVNPAVGIYVTNRVGSSTWHQLRVREQDEIAVGGNFSLSF